MSEKQTSFLYGLIGYPLSHSFSKRFFSEKFEEEALSDHAYDLFPLESIGDIKGLIDSKVNLKGLNVTIPYKEQVMAYLDDIDPTAKEIGAVNTIKIIAGKLIGYNTDVYGFTKSLQNYLTQNPTRKQPSSALILGTGGASKAIYFGLKQLGIDCKFVSRDPNKGDFTYEQLHTTGFLQKNQLIVNTTPLGMYPHVEAAPALSYPLLNKDHLLYDLVYNPSVTLFLSKGLAKGAGTINGLEMLHLQAEKSWEIWNN